jgi:pyruvate dehydrogenase E1 component alpha subunit
LLTNSGAINETKMNEIERVVAAEVDTAVKFAEAGEWEPVRDLTKDVYTK